MGGGMNPLRLAALAASPFCFAKMGGEVIIVHHTNHANHSSKERQRGDILLFLPRGKGLWKREREKEWA